jgi:nucleotide-binding universal stress UspA family protein
MYRKIVVCIDDTPLSERVTRIGADLACRYDADIVLLSVVDPARFARQPYTGLEAVQMLDRHSRSLSNQTHRMGALLHGMGVRSKEMILPGRSVETILNVADEENADLIVIGTEAKSRLHAWLHSDLWSEVSHKASCNVLRVIPAGWIKNNSNGGHPLPQPNTKPNLIAASLSAL